MSRTYISAFILILFISLLSIESAVAGPGGKIASAAFETFWGRIILGGLAIVLLPLILYTWIREKLSERRALSDLRFMARYSTCFDWLAIQQRLKDCFFRIHSSWGQEDLSDVSQWMTSWYWQNQQSVFLNRWKQEGLINICDVKKILAIRPLLFVHRNQCVF